MGTGTHRDGGIGGQLTHCAKGPMELMSPHSTRAPCPEKLTRMPQYRREYTQSKRQQDPLSRGRSPSSKRDQYQMFQQWQSYTANRETQQVEKEGEIWHLHLNMPLLQTSLDWIGRTLRSSNPVRPVPVRRGPVILVLLNRVDVNDGGSFSVGHRELRGRNK